MKQARAIAFVLAFGWRVAHMALDAGSRYGVLVTAPRPRSSVGSYALWTRGEIRGSNLSTGEALAPRVPGTFSAELGPLAVGRLVFNAAVDTEWWCVDRMTNGGELPEVGVVHLAAGEVCRSRVLICTGQHAGQSFDGYVAIEPCLGMIFDREKGA